MPHTPPQRTRSRPVTVFLLSVAVAIVVVAGVGVVDRVVLGQAEGRVAEEVGTQLGVPVDVRIQGRLAGLAVLRGRIGRMTLEASQVPTDQVVVDRLQVDVMDLRLEGEAVVAGTGRFVATVTEQQVRAAAPALIRDLIVLEADRAALGGGLLTVPLALSIDGTDLVISPVLAPQVSGLLAQLLPELGEGVDVPLQVPAGIVVQQADVAAGALRLTGTLDPVVVASS